MTVMHNNDRARIVPRRLRNAAACAALAALLAGCGNLSRVSESGTTDDPVFPAVDDAAPDRGSWPNLENLRNVRAGMSKAQLYQLLGPPHFREGMLGVREWDYLFHLPRGGETMQCQYKVLFDKTMLARSFLWKPQACSEALAPQP
jgi:outer membrane protein assembly factor BamE (lipoprotein component of BamABCDE complex)